jgi:hypothetical protein
MIQYASRTRAETDQFKRMQQMMRWALAGLLAKLPEKATLSLESSHLFEVMR